jgi:hypothetical protein
MASILQPQVPDPQVRLYARIKELEDRVSQLERFGATFPTGSGAPAAGAGKEGSGYADVSVSSRLYLKVNGTWKSVAIA